MKGLQRVDANCPKGWLFEPLAQMTILNKIGPICSHIR
jgi:hypothetical protein